MATDVAGTRRLIVALGEGGGAAHLVYVSIVGVERSRLPYYVAKRTVEREVESSGLPWSIVRATQLHSFALSVLQSLTDDRGTLTVPEGTSAGARRQALPAPREYSPGTPRFPPREAGSARGAHGPPCTSMSAGAPTSAPASGLPYVARRRCARQCGSG